MNELSERDLNLHVTILGWLHIVEDLILLAAGVFVFVLLGGIGLVLGDAEATSILVVTGTAVGLFLVALSIPGILAGYGLLARKSWGRILAIVVGIIGLISFPIGTLIGIYTLWLLTREETVHYFTSLKAT